MVTLKAFAKVTSSFFADHSLPDQGQFTRRCTALETIWKSNGIPGNNLKMDVNRSKQSGSRGGPWKQPESGWELLETIWKWM
jgi:hypothetical protein